MHLVANAVKLREGRTEHLLHSPASRIIGDLGNQAYPCAGGHGDLSLIRQELSREHPEEGRLSSSVFAHQSYPLAGVDLEADAVEQVCIFLKGLYNAFYCNFNHNSSSNSSRVYNRFTASNRPLVLK